MGELKADDDVDEDMKDEIDSVLGLLDRLKDDRKKELLSSQEDKLSRLEKLKGESRNTSTSGTEDRALVDDQRRRRRSKEKCKVMDFSETAKKKSVTVTMNLGQNKERKSSKGSRDSRDSIDASSQEDGDSNVDRQESGRIGPQKRKQDNIVAEIQEKAEVISKSARKGPESVAAAIARVHNIEEDPETVEYLRNIREASLPATSEFEMKKDEESTQKVVKLDLGAAPKTVTVKLNLELQKSKISVAKGAGLKGRRKPTAELRRSWRLSDGDELDDKFAKWESEQMEQDTSESPLESSPPETVESPVACQPVEANVMEASPVEYPHQMGGLVRRGSFDGLIPRTKPKPARPGWKSKTYGGIALPAFAEAMRSGGVKILKKTPSSEAMLTADIVRQAAENKLNRAAKEDKPEKEPEKPAWLEEAETRRKLHDRRRHGTPKIKPEESDKKGITFKLKSTGSRLLQEGEGKKEEQVAQPEIIKVAFKLKPTGNKPVEEVHQEPEKVEVAFKLKPTGIPLIAGHKGQEDVEKSEQSVPVKLRPVADRGRFARTDESAEEPEIAVKLRRVRERLQLQDEGTTRKEHIKVQVPMKLKPVSKPSLEEPEKVPNHVTSFATAAPIKVQSRSEIHAVTLSQKSVESAHVVSPTPTRTKAESTPVLSPTAKSPTKTSYKVTPLRFDDNYIHDRRDITFTPAKTPPSRSTGFPKTRVFESPMSPTSARAYQTPLSQTCARPYNPPTSPPSSRPYQTPLTPTSRLVQSPISSGSSIEYRTPPTSPTSRVTVMSHRVESTPSKTTPKMLSKPARIRARHMSSERSKSVTITASEVAQFKPIRRASAEYPQYEDRHKPPTPEYPKTRVEKAGNGYLKHAVTVVKAKHIPLLSKDVHEWNSPVVDYSYRPTMTGEVLPHWKQELMEKKRKSSREELDTRSSASSWKTDFSEGRREFGTLSNKDTNANVVIDREPPWMKDLAERKRRGQLRKLSTEIQYEMAAVEQQQSTYTQDDDSDQPREVPNFMKEFERKRRAKGRGPRVAHVNDEPDWLGHQRRVRQGTQGPGPSYRLQSSGNHSYV